jgi:hypothetical protein
MSYRIAYGLDTRSIEDPDQLVLMDLPDQCSDMDSEELEDWLNDNEGVHQPLVGQADLLEKVAEACEREGLNGDMIARILDAAAGGTR